MWGGGRGVPPLGKQAKHAKKKKKKQRATQGRSRGGMMELYPFMPMSV
jgi:hypothetical protein